ncbi:N,N-dimethylformamidase beta subunit family domain-containing protein [Streptomyces sioyaensis]|uniref:N,N-dimethylformamidase beta subunit family domain-containing protein n=1 Tax=Streptomyces sioyaensis TaxID=67364 RepID=UPI00379E0C39
MVLAERLGLPLAYTTGLDVHRTPSALRGATAALSPGHDEYWTPQQRQHVTLARDAGTNLAFLGANACFRRVRLEPGPSGALRTVVCYKTSYRDDPHFAGPHRALPTHDFRQPPAADPESALTGVFYEGYPTDASYVVHSADHWLFAGTGVQRGAAFDHFVGVEYDRVTPEAPTPARLEILAHSPLVCNGRRSHADSAYYTVPSGAGVFSSGTMRWVEALMAGTRDDGRDHGMDGRTRAFVTRTTENLLRAFAEAPAAKIRPAPRNNVAGVYGTWSDRHVVGRGRPDGPGCKAGASLSNHGVLDASDHPKGSCLRSPHVFWSLCGTNSPFPQAGLPGQPSAALCGA